MRIDEDRLELTRQLHALVVDYWHDVDTNWGRNATDWYTDDAEFVGDANTYKGKDKIRAFYKWREDRGDRTVIHSVHNFRAEYDGGRDRAVCNWFMFLTAADGTPVLETQLPIQIAYMTDRMVKSGDGWLVAYRKFDPWFMGGIPTTNPNLDDD